MRLRSSMALTAMVWLAASGAFAQTKPAPAGTPSPASTAADPAFEGQKEAFLALDEATRKSIQDSLSWLGFYNGVVDGDFGKRTRDAIVAYQTSIHATVDGVLGPTLVVAVKGAADKARGAVGFQIVEDQALGVRYGAPLKLLDKRVGGSGSLTLTRADKSVALAIEEKKGADADLAAVYAQMTADAPNVKISYKAIKAGAFFVVAGVDSGKKFYRRFEAGSSGGAPVLRGFTFSYPEARSDLDKVTLGIANAFEPFPAAIAISGTTPSATPTSVATPSPRPSTVSKPIPAPAGTGFGAVALVVGPGKAITTLTAVSCVHPSVAGKPATIMSADDTTSLSTLSGDFAPNGGAPALARNTETDGIVVAFAEATPPRLEASDGVLVVRDDTHSVVAPLAKGSTGAPIFARDGALIGLVAPIKSEPLRLGGRLIGQPHAYLAAAAFEKALGDTTSPAQAGTAMSIGDLLHAKSALVVGVTCAP
jgi:peptidoglycan hydrolase-like protein with peptidoglycan-binding domain